MNTFAKTTLFLLPLTLYVGGCQLINLANQVAISSEVAEYNESANKIQLGMRKSEVFSILPDQSNMPIGGLQPQLLRTEDGTLVEIYFYRNSLILDNRKTDDEFTPYLFANDTLIAIGWVAIKAASLRNPPEKTEPAVDKGVSPARQRSTSGSGFVISKSGFILTNHHVVDNCRDINIGISSARVSAKLITSDQKNDLALLKTPTRYPQPATFRGGKGVRSGEQIVVVGFPLTGLLASEANVTVGAVSATSGLLDDTRFLQITAPVQVGNSGGPLLDTSGHVAGVVVAKLDALRVAELTGDIPQNVNFALHGGIARNFLDAHQVYYNSGDSTVQLSSAEIAEIAKKFTVLVECKN